jgi:hypothetical protein
LTLDQVGPNDAITAAPYDASVPAAVRIDSVAIVTGFSRLDASVAASRCSAGVGAIIAIDWVPIVAIFIAWLPFDDILSGDPITAARVAALGSASVFTNAVAVVAGFSAGFTRLKVSARDAVAAGR